MNKFKPGKKHCSSGKFLDAWLVLFIFLTLEFVDGIFSFSRYAVIRSQVFTNCLFFWEASIEHIDHGSAAITHQLILLHQSLLYSIFIWMCRYLSILTHRSTFMTSFPNSSIILYSLFRLLRPFFFSVSSSTMKVTGCLL